MVVIIHNNTQVLEVLDHKFQTVNLSFNKQDHLTESIFKIAKQSQSILVWCHKDLKAFLNIEAIKTICHHHHILASFNTSQEYFLSSKLDYLEREICLKFNKKNTYGTYLMSSQVGVVYAKTLVKFENDINLKKCFNYTLNSIAKMYQRCGLFCYSEPLLLKDNYPALIGEKITNKDFFVFVKEHYKWVWVWFLSVCLIVYDKQLYLFSLINAQRFKQKTPQTILEVAHVNSNRIVLHQNSIDVVIPTIGRKTYLYDVLKDLSKQTLLPKQVIIVEQNGDLNAGTELHYLKDESWPFTITHHFTHQLGVCNARNIALKNLKNDWVFFADDDLRIESNLLQHSLNMSKKYGAKALNYSCLQPQQKQTYFNTGQTFIFGSGSSFVNTAILADLKFNTWFEFGFGEDTDFGAHIRLSGHDVVFASHINLTHLKAPMGGFRHPIPKLWDKEHVAPKPAPTMMLLYKQHFTDKQLKGYKLFLFIKLNAKKNPLNMRSNFKKFKNSWNKSVFYANQLRTTFNA